MSLTDQVRIRFEASDLNSGSVIEAGVDAVSVQLLVCGATEPELFYNPTSHNFGSMNSGDTDSMSLEIWNDGVGLLSFSLSVSESWLSVSPLSGESLGDFDVEVITVEVDTMGLSDGPYHGEIMIDSNGGSGVFDVYLYVGSGIHIVDVNQSVFYRGFPIRHSGGGDWGGAQSFVPSLGALTSADVYLRKFGSPEFDLVVELWKDHPEGTFLDSVVVPVADVPSTWGWLSVDFVDVVVESGVEYFIVIPPPSGVTTSNGYMWGYEPSDVYGDGRLWFTRNGGNSWFNLGSYEFTFRTY